MWTQALNYSVTVVYGHTLTRTQSFIKEHFISKSSQKVKAKVKKKKKKGKIENINAVCVQLVSLKLTVKKNH